MDGKAEVDGITTVTSTDADATPRGVLSRR